MGSLNEFLEEQEQTEKEAFKVTDDNSANWVLRKIKQNQEQQESSNKLAVSEIEKIEAWNKAENDEAQRNIDYFQGLLAYYAMSKRTEDPKWKSAKYPNGKIKFVKQQPKFNYDDDLLVKSLKELERTDLIKTKESPDKATIKKVFTVADDKLVDKETGVVIEGVKIEHREDDFKVEAE